MSLHRPVGLKRPAAFVLAAVTLTALTLTASTGAQASAAGPTTTYIVQLKGDPLATYSGTEAGFAATKPAKGAKFNAHTAAASAYGSHIKAKQKDALAKLGIDSKKIVYQYDTTFNGVAVELTAAQAAKLKGSGSVLQIWKNHTVTIQTPPTDEFLGLTGTGGVWKKQFGSDKLAGQGVIIGDIDTGFWPESPSFAALHEPRADDALIASKWHGTCDAGEDHTVTCNSKVIGARWFNAAYQQDGTPLANPGEYHSPRDYDGHGSHTASTAAGVYVPTATINGTSAGDVEGVAPGARLAIYKVLYERADGTTASGSGADIVAAIDQAVSDGVDVINYSVGDNVDSFGPEELAFFNAAAAGVFVSAAAGNAGPGDSTVDNAMPYETTVAAGTYDKSWTKSLTLGNGATYTGVGVGAAVPSAPLVDSATAALAPATVTDATLCKIGSLDPALVTGKIVLCQRGVYARTDKSKAVQQAGGVGVILWNASTNSLNADYHFVPTVHVDTATGTAIKAYIAAGGSPTASLAASVAVKVEAPAVAAFSSRGPSLFSNSGLLKPDIMAPGNDVVAAVSPSNHSGNLYDTESGTSMATPHIAGVAALIKSKHQDWSPMAIKSAIMTTASNLDNQGNPIQGNDGDATPFEMGSGEVNPASAFSPGLVYDSGPYEWLQYLCGVGVHLGSASIPDYCTVTGSVTPSNFNSSNIAVGDLTGAVTVTRTVTNVDTYRSYYNAKVAAPAGFKVKVVPSHLELNPGQSASFQVTITRTSKAPLEQYAYGSLTWVNPFAPRAVRSTIAVNPVAISAPDAVSFTGTSGSQAVPVTTGYAGTLTTSVAGLVAGTEHDSTLAVSPGFNQSAPATSPGTSSFEVVVPSGTQIARFQTFASDYPAGTDIDLYVYAKGAGGALTQAGISAGGTASESVTLNTPGDYVVFVDMFALPTGASSLGVKAYDYQVGSTSAGNLTATPASQSTTLAGTATVTLNWSGLTAGQHYLGVLTFGDGTNVIGSTLVSLDA